jgi:hypothetical protein
MKHLITAMIMTMTAAPSFSYAASLCRQVLKQAPSSQAINKTLRSLAQMKMTLDLAKANGSNISQTRMLLAEFKKKQVEAQHELNLSKDSLQSLLEKHIHEFQNHEKEGQKKEEERIRNEQAEVMNTRWRVKKTIPIPLSPISPNGYMISADHDVAFLYRRVGDSTLMDLSTGKEEVLNLDTNTRSFSYSSLPISGKFLFQVSGTELKILDLKTKELKPFAVDAIADGQPGLWHSKESPDGSFVLLINGQSEYRLVDINTGGLIQKGTLPIGNLTNVTLIDRDKIILSTSFNNAYTYSFSKNESTPLATHEVANVEVLKNGDYVYAQNGMIYSYDHTTDKTSERSFTFSPAVYILMQDGPSIWIRTGNSNNNVSQLVKINSKTLEDAPSNPVGDLPYLDFQLYNLDETSMVIKTRFSSDFIPGIYDKRDLTLLIPFNEKDLNNSSKTQDLFVSSNRKKMIHYGKDSAFQTQIEIWERK